jgi:uncharacterized protein YbjQ (UPF0145 family)
VLARGSVEQDVFSFGLDKGLTSASFGRRERYLRKFPIMIVSATNEIVGFKTVRHFGIVRRFTARSRSVVSNFVDGIQSISRLCGVRGTRAAGGLRCPRTQSKAVPSWACATTQTTSSLKFLAYGTAVWVEPLGI